MPTIPTVVAGLLAHPRPVLCIDTCDILDVIQCVAEREANRLECYSRLRDSVAFRPDEVNLVLSYLVPIEWSQNQVKVNREVEIKINQIDKDIADLHLACQHLEILPLAPVFSYSGRNVPVTLAALADTILGSATVLDRDETCISRALDRVHHKQRPSHAGMVKDSIHLEHYLELCRQLHAGGFTMRRVFVSANKADFCEAKNKPNLHPDLAQEFASVGMEFFASLEAAMGSLGI